MNYTFKDNNIKVVREEKEGATIVSATKTGVQLVLNQTGTQVLKLLPVCNSVEGLIEEMSMKYNKLNSKILEQDILEILHLFEIYDVVLLEENINDKKNFRVSIAGDVDYKKISKFVNNCLDNDCIKYCRINDKDYFSTIHLRLRTMQNKEFGVFVEYSGKIKGFLTFSGEGFLTTNVLLVTSLFFDATVENQKEILFIMLNHVIRQCITQKNVKKIRLPVIINEKEDAICNKLIEMGFIKEAVLKDEVEENDLVFYTYWV